MTFTATCSRTVKKNSTIFTTTKISSLAEIAENAGITRQGVRDVLVRAEATLNELEEKTGLIQRFLKVRAGLNSIGSAAERIAALNNGVLNSTELASLVESIQTTVDMLKE